MPEPPPPPLPPAVATLTVNGTDDLDVPRPLRVAAAWAWRILVLVAAGVAVVWLVARLQLVVIPLVVATLLTALLYPLVAQLRQLGLPRSLAAFLVLVAGVAAVVGTLYLVISQFVRGLPDLTDKAGGGFDKIQEWTKNGPLHLSQQQLDDFGKQASDY